MAERLVMSGFDGIMAREKAIPACWRISRAAEAAERVVGLFEAWVKPVVAAAWQQNRALRIRPPASLPGPDLCALGNTCN
jgi:hypothetical protein